MKAGAEPLRLSPPRRRGSRASAHTVETTAAATRRAGPPGGLDPRVRGDNGGEEARPRRVLVIACGALAREALALDLDGIDLRCLPANLHNRPERIPEAVATVRRLLDQLA